MKKKHIVDTCCWKIYINKGFEEINLIDYWKCLKHLKQRNVLYVYKLTNALAFKIVMIKKVQFKNVHAFKNISIKKVKIKIK